MNRCLLTPGKWSAIHALLLDFFLGYMGTSHLNSRPAVIDAGVPPVDGIQDASPLLEIDVYMRLIRERQTDAAQHCQL